MNLIGGAKVWECTETVGDYLTKTNNGKCLIDEFGGKSVLDLGCGAGILGILALNNGASVHFQDYVRVFQSIDPLIRTFLTRYPFLAE